MVRNSMQNIKKKCETTKAKTNRLEQRNALGEGQGGGARRNPDSDAVGLFHVEHACQVQGAGVALLAAGDLSVFKSE